MCLLFLYISSVMRFILFDSVITKECHIRKGWTLHRHHGLQLFGWQLLISLVSIAGLLIIIGFPMAGAWTLGWFNHPRDHLVPLILSGLLFFIVFAAFVLILLLVQVMTKDFVVPQMALENLSAMEGWRRLWSWLQIEKAGYAGYIGMKVVLAIGVGVFLAIIAVIVLIAFLIPVIALGVIAGLSGTIAGLTWNFFTITLAAFAALIAFAISMFAVSFISVPAIVFFSCLFHLFLGTAISPAGRAAVATTKRSGATTTPPTEPPPWSPAPI